MLRPGLERDRCEAAWRASSGTAAVLGLCRMSLDVAPTTAYLMLGGRCARDCAFCTQARTSRADDAALSRVLWPEFPASSVAEAVARAHARGDLQRACFQVTVARDHIARTCHAVAELAADTPVPICVSAAPADLGDVAALLDAGAERVSIALDAADEATYRRVKGSSWQTARELLRRAAERFPGRIATHLIVGLGETEEQMLRTVAWAAELGVSVALFAFTPVRGTALEGVAPPPVDSYRRVQVGRWLLVDRLQRLDALEFDGAGRVVSYGLSVGELARALSDGAAFRTSGCPGCNRPYYNERPGGVLYNYPRTLTAEEARRETDLLLASLRADG